MSHWGPHGSREERILSVLWCIPQRTHTHAHMHAHTHSFHNTNNQEAVSLAGARLCDRMPVSCQCTGSWVWYKHQETTTVSEIMKHYTFPSMLLTNSHAEGRATSQQYLWEPKCIFYIKFFSFMHFACTTFMQCPWWPEEGTGSVDLELQMVQSSQVDG